MAQLRVTFFFGKIEEKCAMLCLKCKSPNIHFLFIEHYKLKITFVKILMFGKTALLLLLYCL